MMDMSRSTTAVVIFVLVLIVIAAILVGLRVMGGRAHEGRRVQDNEDRSS